MSRHAHPLQATQTPIYANNEMNEKSQKNICMYWSLHILEFRGV